MEKQITSFRDENRWLSNYHPSGALCFGLVCTCAESAFQAAKTTDILERHRISQLTGREAKEEGRRLPLRKDWDEIKDVVMFEVLRSKFLMQPLLREKLLATRGAEIIEHNTSHDLYWGKCVCPNCINLPFKNQLGRIIMILRDELLLMEQMMVCLPPSVLDIARE